MRPAPLSWLIVALVALEAAARLDGLIEHAHLAHEARGARQTGDSLSALIATGTCAWFAPDSARRKGQRESQRR